MKKRIFKVLTGAALFAVIIGCTMKNRGVASETESRAAKNTPAVSMDGTNTAEILPNDTSVVEIEVNDLPDNKYDDWFEIQEINDSIFNRIKGVSFKSNCTVPREDLRYITVAHYTLNGEVKKGELICHKLIADDMLDIFHNLYDARYPIERMELVDNYDADDRKSMSANNTSCFNFRLVAGSNHLSNHALGLAIDLNPRYNPYVKKQKNGSLYVSPQNGTKYADRKADYPYKIDENDLAYKEFIAHGFNWGGHWKTMQDYQHFEKKIPGLKY